MLKNATFCVDKSSSKMPLWSILMSFRTPEVCGQTVLPDTLIWKGPKLVENAKIEKFKCDIFWRFSKRRWWTWQAAESLHYDLQLKEFTMIIIKMTFGRGSIEHQKSSQLFCFVWNSFRTQRYSINNLKSKKVPQQVWKKIPNVKKKNSSFICILEK